MPRIESALRQVRARLALPQRELAAKAGISRQALSELEAGHACPSTAVALALARVLGCRVEDLFSLAEDAGSIQADLALLEAERGSAAGRFRRTVPPPRVKAERAALAFVGERWVAHPLSADQPTSMWQAADALVLSLVRKPAARPPKLEVSPLRSRSELRDNLLVAGCDPAIGLLAAWLSERQPRAKLVWLYAPSHQALRALARREVHLAGAHLFDEDSGEFNVPFARTAALGGGAVVVNFARWEEGLLVAPGNPLALRGVSDLTRRNVRLVNREWGSEARKLLDRLLRKERIEPKRVKGYERVAHGHLAVAHAVAFGAADAGIATRSAASALGLSFLPLSEERFDFILPKALLSTDGVKRLLDVLENQAFRRELATVSGYATEETGQVVGETGQAS